MRRAPFWCIFWLSVGLCQLAHAQDCPADDLNKVSALQPDPDIQETVSGAGDEWLKIASKLYDLRTMVLAEHARAPFFALAELAVFLEQVLDAYDGSLAKAKLLRAAMLKPETCPNDADGFPICAWEVLDGKVQVPVGASGAWTCGKKYRFAKYLNAARGLLELLLTPLVAQAARDLGVYATQWQRFVTNGYSQYPWEVALNGWLLLDEQAWGPSANQLIFAHAATGFGTSGLAKGDGQTTNAALIVALEAAGYLRYFRDFRHHVGVSAALALPNFRWDDVGLGPVLHLDGFGIGYSRGLTGEHVQAVYFLIDVTRGIDDSLLLRKANGWVRDKLD